MADIAVYLLERGKAEEIGLLDEVEWEEVEIGGKKYVVVPAEIPPNSWDPCLKETLRVHFGEEEAERLSREIERNKEAVIEVYGF